MKAPLLSLLILSSLLAPESRAGGKGCDYVCDGPVAAGLQLLKGRPRGNDARCVQAVRSIIGKCGLKPTICAATEEGNGCEVLQCITREVGVSCKY